MLSDICQIWKKEREKETKKKGRKEEKKEEIFKNK